MSGMELIEIESEQTMRREEAARVLRQLADSLARHNEVEFLREGLRFRVSVPDEVEVEFELEIEGDATSIEIEISW